MAAPVIAAGIMAGAALGKGIYDTYQASKEATRARHAQEKAREQARQDLSNWESEATRILEEANANNIRLSSPQEIEAYKEMKASYDPSKYVYDFEPFDKSSYHVEDYLNPRREAILEDVAKGIQHTAAGSALGHSSGAAAAIMQGLIDKDETLYDKAFDRMVTERNFDYGAYTDYINQQQQRLTALQQGVLGQMQLMRGDITFDQEQQAAYLATKLNLGNTLAQTRAQIV